MRRSARLVQREEQLAPPPPPKRPKKLQAKDRARGQHAYDYLDDIAVSAEKPNYSLLEQPLGLEKSRALGYSIHLSRANWLAGPMFETFWTRKPRGKKLKSGEANVRDKMTKFTEGFVQLGPHTMAVKFFLVKDEQDTPPKKEPAKPGDPQANLSKPEGNGTIHAAPGPASDQQQPQVPTPTDVKNVQAHEPIHKPSESPAPTPPQPVEQPQETTLTRDPAEEKIPPLSSSMNTGPAPSTEVLEDGAAAVPESDVNAPTSTGSDVAAPPAASDADPSQLEHDKPPKVPKATKAPKATQKRLTPSAVQQMVVFRLQQMAQQDHALGLLMREVASGAASPSTVARFQVYIDKAKSLDAPPKKVASTTPKPPAPVMPRRSHKSIMLAFEFDENPSERFLIPKQSIIEVTESDEVLVSFLHVIKGKKHIPAIYTPITMTIKGVQPRLIPTIERCFDSVDKVAAKMKEIMQSGVRSEQLYVWYDFDATDAMLLEEIKKMPAPVRTYQEQKRQRRSRAKAAEDELEADSAELKSSRRSAQPTQAESFEQGHDAGASDHQIPVSDVANADSSASAARNVVGPVSSGPETAALQNKTVDAEREVEAAASGQIPTTGDGSVSEPKPRAKKRASTGSGPKQKVARTQTPQVTSSITPAPAANSPVVAPVMRPKLELPDIDQFAIPRGELPPLPASLRNSELFQNARKVPENAENK